MTPRVELELDEASLKNVEREIISHMLLAGVMSVKTTTRWLERQFESLTRAKVKGRAWRAWRSDTFPKRNVPAYDPVGIVSVNGGRRSRGMIRYFTLPGVVRPKRGNYLAVPLAAALNTPKGRHITPREWEGRNGVRLRPLFRPGETALLVADGAVTSTGAFQALPSDRIRAKQRGGQKLRRVTVPVFALLTDQDHANTVSLAPSIRQARAGVHREFRRRLSR